MKKVKTRIISMGIILTVVLFALLCTLLGGRIYPTVYAESEDILAEYIFDPINNGQEYSVRAANKKSITKARIPHIYNGKFVTEIANNGFALCANLKEISIPNSIKRIGNNAFLNCTQLVKVHTFESMENREMEIGSNAFYNCSNAQLDN